MYCRCIGEYKRNSWCYCIIFDRKKRTEVFSVPDPHMAGVIGFEPMKWQIQSLLPYRLAIPQYAHLFYIFFDGLATIIERVGLMRYHS